MRVRYIVIFLIFLLAFLLRFYYFDTRWGLGGDDARDAAIAKIALERGKSPLIGSFSSAGPFVFGPLFYWFIMGSYAALPALYSPWLILAALSVINVALTIAVGRVLGSTRLGLVAGLLAVSSPQLVFRTLVLTQHSFIAFLATLSILFLALLWEKKKTVFSFALGMSIGTALSFHYQALNLLLLVPLTFLPLSRKSILFLSACIIGMIIPSIPLLLWDSNQNFANFRNLMDYFLVAQHRIYVPSSWRLFLGEQLPNYWSFVIGSNNILSIFLLLLLLPLVIFFWTKKFLNFSILGLTVAFSAMLILARYYKGERSEGYLLYLLPFIIVFSSWVINKLISLQKIAGSVVLVIVLWGNFTSLSTFYSNSDNHISQKLSEIETLKRRFPGEKFSLYDLAYNTAADSEALSLLLYDQKLIGEKGRPIGVCFNCPKNVSTLMDSTKYKLVSLPGPPAKVDGWHNVNPDSLYDSLITYWEDHKLRSTFSLTEYLRDRLQSFISGT